MKGKGGYYMVDAGALNLANTSAQLIDGINAKLTEALALGKPVMLYNFRYSSTMPSTPAYVTVHAGSSGIVYMQIDNYMITVS